MILDGVPRTEDEALFETWAKDTPRLAEILQKPDAIAAVTAVVYTLTEPRNRDDLQMQEELVYLWSSDPDDKDKIGDTSLLPAFSFPGKLLDIQYRGLNRPTGILFGKIILQILHIREGPRHWPLGGFVIVSKPRGEYEFYLVPRSLLGRLLVD